MSTLSTCTALLPFRGFIGRDYPKAQDKQEFATEKENTLRFYCVWENSTRNFGSKAPILLHYFLKDDTIECRQLQLNMPHNHAFMADLASQDEMHPFPPVLKRQKIGKPAYVDPLKPTSGGMRPCRPSDGWYHWTDLRVGNPINIYGQNLLVMECDMATAKHYERHNLEYGCATPVQLERLTLPSDKFFDDPDSEYAKSTETVRKLQKKVSLSSTSTKPTQYMNYTGRGTPAMRFKASMVSAPNFSARRSDLERQFLVSFYLNDDTIEIAEPPNKVTRTGGAHFFIRQHALKPSLDNPYKPGAAYDRKDFHVGAFVPVLLTARKGYEAEGPKMLQLLEADTWTLDFMESRPQDFPCADYNTVQMNLLDHLSVGDRAQKFVNKINECTKGIVYRKQLYKFLKELGVDVCMHDCITLTRRLDHDGAGVEVPVLAEELSLPPYEASMRDELPPGRWASPSATTTSSQGKVPSRAQTAIPTQRRPGSLAQTTGSYASSVMPTGGRLGLNRLGHHVFGMDPTHNKYYNRTEHGTHLIDLALNNKGGQLPAWA